MPRAFRHASVPRYVPKPPIVCLAALIAVATLVVPTASLGAKRTRKVKVLLGDTAIESQHGKLVAGRSEAFRLRAHASGLAVKLRLYIDMRSTAATVVVGLYRDLRGRPGALLATGSIAAPRKGAWNAVTLARGSRLVAGRPYWLTVLGEGGTLRYRARPHGRCRSAASIRANLSTLPSAWSAGRMLRHAHCPISAYATAASSGSPRGSSAPVSLIPPVISALAPGAQPSPGDPFGGGSPLISPPVEQAHPPAAPVNGSLPTIGGTLTVGDVLSSTKGTWSGTPSSYAYRWQDCDATGKGCGAISGATVGTYTLKSSDIGHTLRVTVTAANTGGSTAATSLATTTVTTTESPPPPPPPPPPPGAPTNTKLPTISGATMQGQALAVATGTWSGSPTSYAYQWQDCNAAGEGCANIGGATATGYTLTADDVGHTLRAVVTATNGGGSTAAGSQASGLVVVYTSGSPYPECTQTISQGANVASAVSGATSGSVICLNSGEYGSLTLNSAHSGDVTLQAAPQAHAMAGNVTLGGSHIVVRGLWIDNEVALEEGASFITIDRDDITGGSEGIVFDTSDCTVPNAPQWAGCEPHAPITDVTISANHIHDIGEGGGEDAIHLDNWRRVKITGNEFDHIVEAGDHTDCVQSVYGGDQLSFDHNYEHDNDCQGFFIKDGDATNVSFTENLFLRDQIGSFANFAQVWNVQGLTIQHNTVWDGKGFALVAEGASFTPTATIDHNVLNIFKVSQPIGNAYSITEGNDIFGESPTNLSEGSGDSVVANPQFAKTATDDYRLAGNPNGIGIDWSPAEQQYGPAG
jgi:hypothetical protein